MEKIAIELQDLNCRFETIDPIDNRNDDYIDFKLIMYNGDTHYGTFRTLQNIQQSLAAKDFTFDENIIIVTKLSPSIIEQSIRYIVKNDHLKVAFRQDYD